MSAFAHTLLVIVGYIIAIFAGLLYLNLGIMLWVGSCDLKYLAAPKHVHNGIRPLYWGELSPNDQAKAKTRLPVAIITCALVWIAYLLVGYFIVIRIILPAIVTFFSNIH